MPPVASQAMNVPAAPVVPPKNSPKDIILPPAEPPVEVAQLPPPAAPLPLNAHELMQGPSGGMP